MCGCLSWRESWENEHRLTVRNFGDGPQWVPGGIVKVLRQLSYVVQVRCGQRWKQHVDHIREGPSVQSLNPEAEIIIRWKRGFCSTSKFHGRGRDSNCFYSAKCCTSQTQGGDESTSASPPGDPSVTVQSYLLHDCHPPNCCGF